MEWFSERPGGLNRYLGDLLEALRARGVAARAVSIGAVAERSPYRIETSAVGEALPVRVWRFGWAACSAGDGADLVDAHFALYAFVPTIVGRLRRLPLVVHFHGPWAQESAGQPAWTLWLKGWVECRVYRRAREAVVLSGAFKRLLVERYGVSPWRIHVVPPGVDLQWFCPASKAGERAEMGVSQDAWVCLAVRRLVPRMGLDVLLGAWSLLAASRQDVVLLIAGDGPERGHLEALAMDLGIASSVRFLGRLEDAKVVSCYRAADVCVVPSVALEGFGLVVLEALACGTPVVATDVGGLPDALSQLDASLVVPGGDPSALARRLRDAVDGRVPLPDAQECRAYAEGFSWDKAAARNLEVYRQALEPPARTALRVVYLDHCADLSGGELALARLLPALQNVEAHVVLAEEGPLVPRLLSAGISVEVLLMGERARGLRRDRVRPGRLPVKALVASALHVGRLAHRLRQLSPDIVHTNSLKSAIYGGLAGRIAGIPVVWHVRDRIADDYLPRPAVRLVRAVARRVPTAVIANSESTLNTLTGLGNRSWVIPDTGLGNRSLVIPSPVVAAGRSPSRSGGPSMELRVGMLGRIAPWKGQHVFLEAFARAFPGNGGPGGAAQGIIVGAPLFGEEAYERELKELVASLALDGRVEFAGFVDDVAGCLEGLDILVHASVIPEPFGQVVVEGMAAGLPVVAARAGGPAEVIEDGVTGLLYSPGDAVALADALRRLAQDPQLREQLGQAAQVEATKYTPEVLAPRVMAVYRQVLGQEVPA
jgi:glycosyltransferase involved in cell wall biosynthesis